MDETAACRPTLLTGTPDTCLQIMYTRHMSTMTIIHKDNTQFTHPFDVMSISIWCTDTSDPGHFRPKTLRTYRNSDPGHFGMTVSVRTLPHWCRSVRTLGTRDNDRRSRHSELVLEFRHSDLEPHH